MKETPTKDGRCKGAQTEDYLHMSSSVGLSDVRGHPLGGNLDRSRPLSVQTVGLNQLNSRDSPFFNVLFLTG